MRKYHYGVIAAIILLGLLTLGSLAGQRSAAYGPEALSGAMRAAGATAEQFSVNAWTKLPAADLRDAELDAVVRTAMARLGFKPDEYELRHTRSERHRLVRAEATAGRQNAVAAVQVLYPAWDSKGAEAYLVVNVETAAAETTITEWHKKVAAAVGGAGGSPRITTCLVGWLGGKLERDEWDERLDRAGRSVEAVFYDTLVQPDFTSITGFSPLLADWLQVGDKRVNLNMAMRYSPYDNRTYIVIGSPVITGEY